MGWENVSLTDTTPFDTECQYRVTSSGTVFYTSIVGNVVDNAAGMTNGIVMPYSDGFAAVWGGNKNGAWKKRYLHYDPADPWTLITPLPTSWKIEKFCLPAYN